MPGKNLNLNPLESRKRLLLAESDLNRAQMVREWQRLTDESHAFAHHARTVGSIISATALLVAGIKSFGCKKAAPPAGKPSWLQSILKGAGLMATLWPLIRPAARD